MTDEELMKAALSTPLGTQMLDRIKQLEVQNMRAASVSKGVDAQTPRRGIEVVVIAGNVPQAEAYVRASNLSPFDVTIARDVDRIRPLREYDVVLTGTWYRRPDLSELLDVVQATVVARKLRGDNTSSGGDMQAAAGTMGVNQGPSTLAGTAYTKAALPRP